MKLTHTLFVLFWALFFSTPSFSQDWVWGRCNTGGASMDGWPVATDKAGNVFTAGIRWNGNPAVFGTITVPNTGVTGSMYQPIIAKYDAAGNCLWAKGATHGDARVIGLTVDPDGNAILLGSFRSQYLKFGSILLTNSYALDDQYFVAKFDPSGNVLWALNAGNAQQSFYTVPGFAPILGLGAVSIDAHSNIYISTNFHKPNVAINAGISLTNANAGGTTDDILLVKYDPTGNVVWAKSFGGSGNDDVYGMTVTHAGDIYLSGMFGSAALNFGSVSISNAGLNQVAFIARLDNSGNGLWASASGGTGKEYAMGLASELSNNVYLTGGLNEISISYAGTTISNPSSVNSIAYLVKFDPSNNVTWAKTFASPYANGRAWGYAVATSVCGDVWVVGSMTKSDSMTDTASRIPIAVNIEGHIVSVPPWSNDPIFIAGFSSSGTFINASGLMAGGDDQDGIACDGVGNVYVGADYFGNTSLTVANDILPVDGATIEVLYIAKYAPRNLNGTVFKHKDTTLCYNKGLTVYAQPGFSNYLWSNGHRGNDFAVTDTGVFWVFAQDSCASALHDTFRIDGICDCIKTLFVPNSFTPNGDGQNDLFYPRSGAGVTKVTLFQVFNRWGTLLFERENIMPNDINSAWDGSYQGGYSIA